MSQDMPQETHEMIKVEGVHLFDRIVSILEQARGNVVRSVNANMVLAYWLIGREIVEKIQAEKKRAQYGKQVLEELSAKLNRRYGSGFSEPNLRNFRMFYQVFQSRLDIQYPAGTQLASPINDCPSGETSSLFGKQYPAGSELVNGFNAQLSWSHYRALMRVKNPNARDFYEQEAAECTWSKTQLERQIAVIARRHDVAIFRF